MEQTLNVTGAVREGATRSDSRRRTQPCGW